MSIQSYLKSHPLIHLTDTCLRSRYLPDIVLGPWDISVRETNNRSISCGSYILEGCASYCCCVINFPQILAALNSHHFSHSSWFCMAGTRRGPAGRFFASVSCGGGGVPLERQRQLLFLHFCCLVACLGSAGTQAPSWGPSSVVIRPFTWRLRAPTERVPRNQSASCKAACFQISLNVTSATFCW